MVNNVRFIAGREPMPLAEPRCGGCFGHVVCADFIPSDVQDRHRWKGGKRSINEQFQALDRKVRRKVCAPKANLTNTRVHERQRQQKFVAL